MSTTPRSPQMTTTQCRYEQVVEHVTEWCVFQALDNLRPTATGLDQLPAWFLRLGAPAFAKLISYLVNLSLSTSSVPTQWKSAYITPVPKIQTPKITVTSAQYLSAITSVLSRVTERIVVSQFLYPAFLSPSSSLNLSEQFAFRPSGPTTAALISILHSVTSLLHSNDFVAVIALDFSKACDTVRHWTLLDNMALLDLPDEVYNWMVDYFSGHTHCTNSVWRAHLRNARHHRQHRPGFGYRTGVVRRYCCPPPDCQTNLMVKYADDTYLVIPACNVQSRAAELDG